MLITEGTFNSSIDSGGRFQLPVALRPVSAQVEGRFVMNMGVENVSPSTRWTNGRYTGSSLVN